MNIIRNQSLKNYNTFQINQFSDYFVEVESINELKNAIKYSQTEKIPYLLLGQGSNILLSEKYKGIVIKINIKGIEVISKTTSFVELKVNAGEIWDDFVSYCVNNNFFGVENLSLIPGTVGACPVQNIGAYGVEVKDVIQSVNVIDVITFEQKTFNNNECNFEYRNSIFKSLFKNKYIITSVVFKLSIIENYNLSYGQILSELELKRLDVNLQNVRKLICEIRESKLPDPKIKGNSGSFFKNPIVSIQDYLKLKENYSNIPSYYINDEFVKVPAAWLIDYCGWKGKIHKSAAVHSKQALVLINNDGNSDGKDIIELSDKIKESIYSKFNIHLEVEVNII